MTELVILAITAGTPLVLAATGELMLQRSGIINIALEGMMLVAALGGVLGTAATGSVAFGVVTAVIASLLMALTFGFFTITRREDQIVVGTALNLVALGVTGVAYQRLSDTKLLSITSSMTFDVITPFAWVVIPLAAGAILWRTRAGLRIRAAGEYPPALDLQGSSSARYQWLMLLAEALLTGLAGAYLAIVLSHGFAENMVAGRGFIALAIVTFSRWTAKGVVAAVALFAAATALQYAAQAAQLGLQHHLLLAMPYVVTLLLTMFASELRAPAWLGRR